MKLREILRTISIWGINFAVKMLAMLLLHRYIIELANDILTAKDNDMIAIVDIDEAKKLMAVGLMLLIYGTIAVIVNIILFTKAYRYSALTILLDAGMLLTFVNGYKLYDKNFIVITGVIIFIAVEIVINAVCRFYTKSEDTEDAK